jgi:hypothetical protein
VLKHHNSTKVGRPIVEVLLIRKSAVFNPVVAPFQAPLSPPMKTLQSCFVSSKTQKPDIVYAEDFQLVEVLRETVSYDKD